MLTRGKKRALSWLLALVMLVGMVPTAAFAEGGEPHHQAGFEDDWYYTGSCETVPGAPVRSDEPDQCTVQAEPEQEPQEAVESEEGVEAPVEPEKPVLHEHGDECYTWTETEDSYACERYPYITVTFMDGADEVGAARVVQGYDYREEAPQTDGLLYWADQDGLEADWVSYTQDAVVYALRDGALDFDFLNQPAANGGPEIQDGEAQFSMSAVTMQSCGETVSSISGPIDPSREIPVSELRVEPVLTKTTLYGSWYFLFDGKIEIDIAKSGPIGNFKIVDHFIISGTPETPELWVKAAGEQYRVEADGSNLLVQGGWTFAFENNSDAGVEIQYTTDGTTLNSLDAGERLYLFDAEHVEKMRTYNPDEVIDALTQKLMFFVKAAESYKPVIGGMSGSTGLQDGNVYDLAEIRGNGDYAYFADAMDAALAQGFTREFSYTGSSSFSSTTSGHAVRGFRFTAEPEEDRLITYHKNSDAATGEMPPQSVPYNGTATLSECTFENFGYVFDRWDTSPDGDGVSYGQRAVLEHVQSAIELYAIWREAKPEPAGALVHINKLVKGVENTNIDLLPKQLKDLTITLTNKETGAETKLTLDHSDSKISVQIREDAQVANAYQIWWQLRGILPQGEYTVTEAGYDIDTYSCTPNPVGGTTALTVNAAGGSATITNTYAKAVPPSGRKVTFYIVKDTVSPETIATLIRTQKTGVTAGDVAADGNDRFTSVGTGYMGSALNQVMSTGDGAKRYLSARGDFYHPETGSFAYEDFTAVNLALPEGTTYQDYTWYVTKDTDKNELSWHVDGVLTTRLPQGHTVTYQVDESLAPTESWGSVPQQSEHLSGAALRRAPALGTQQRFNPDKTVPGTWSFQWVADDKALTFDQQGNFTMPDHDVVFTGTWTFQPAVIQFYILDSINLEKNPSATFESVIAAERTGLSVSGHGNGGEYTGVVATGKLTEDLAKAVLGQNVQWVSLRADDYRAGAKSFLLEDYTDLSVAGSSVFSDVSEMGAYTWYVTKETSGGQWHVDGVLTAKLRTYTVEYLGGAHASFDPQVKYPGLTYASNTPAFRADGSSPVSRDPGFVFAGWKAQDADQMGLEATVTRDTVYEAQWQTTTDFDYYVEFYYQENGQYGTALDSRLRQGSGLDQPVSVTEADRRPSGTGGRTFVLDEARNEDWSGKIKEGGALTLKVYFKEQFTVTYEPGAQGTFAREAYPGLDYNAARPLFLGQTTGNSGYRFDGWSAPFVDTVTGNQTYVAQWTATGGTGPVDPGDDEEEREEGGGEGDIPDTEPPLGPGGGDLPAAVPGTPPDSGDVTIPDTQLPLGDGQQPDESMVIVDPEIPLGNLPQTGTRSQVDPTATLGAAALLFSLAVGGLLQGRRREDQETE